MTKSNITVYSFMAWFCVNTVHGSSLEFVLAEADERRGDPRIGHETTTYTDRLDDMLKQEFAKDESIRVNERQEYGDISFLIEADSTTQLEQALSRCDDIVKRWISKYHISKMKRAGAKPSKP